MAAITLPVGFVRVAWLAPNLTLSAATWKNNIDAIYRENAARTTLVNFKPGSGVNAVTTLVQNEFYLFKVKTQFQLDDSLIGLVVPAAPTVAAPTITSFSPTSGQAGTALTITGTNLANAYAVVVNNVVAAISANTATSITASIPALATTGVVKVYTAGGVATSSTALTVVQVNQAPSVALSGNNTGTVGVLQSFQAIASDSDGTVQKVELVDAGGNVLATDTTSPYVLDWTPSAAGTFPVRAKVTDNGGATSFSSDINVVVQATTNTQLVRTASGLQAQESFADVSSWSLDTLTQQTQPTLVSFSRSPIRALVHGPTDSLGQAYALGTGVASNTDAGGIREGSPLRISDKEWYLYYGAGALTGTTGQPWRVQVAHTTDGGLTWKKLGDMGLGNKRFVETPGSTSFQAQDWAANDLLFVEKRGSFYYMIRMRAGGVYTGPGGQNPGVIPDPPYTAELLKASTPLGPWSFVQTIGIPGDSPGINDRDSYAQSVVAYQGKYYWFTSDVTGPISNGQYYSGLYVSDTYEGPKTRIPGAVMPPATNGKPENPKVFYHAGLGKYVFLVTQLDTPGQSTACYVSDSPIDWSNSPRIDIQFNSLADGQNVINIASPMWTVDGEFAQQEGYVPVSFDSDAYPTAFDGTSNCLRNLLWTVFEPSPAALALPAPGSSGGAGSLFFDNFNRINGAPGNGWATVVGSPDMALADGHINLGSDPGDVTAFNSGTQVANGSVEARITVALNASIGLIFRAQDPNNFYVADFACNAGTLNTTLYKKQGGTFTQIGNAVTQGSFPADSTQTVRVSFAGSAIQCYLQDTQVATFSDSTFTTGVCGLRNGGAATGTRLADNFRVTDANATTTPQLLFQDDFNRVDGVPGNGWVVAYGSTPLVISAGRMNLGSASGDNASVNNGTTTSNGSVQATITVGNTCSVGLVYRYQDSNNFYFADYTQNNGVVTIRLYKKVGGSYTTLQEVTGPAWDGSAVPVKVTYEGTTHTVYFNGQQMLTLSDATFTSGSSGLRNGGIGTGNRLADDFAVYTTGFTAVVPIDVATRLLNHIDGVLECVLEAPALPSGSGFIGVALRVQGNGDGYYVAVGATGKLVLLKKSGGSVAVIANGTGSQSFQTMPKIGRLRVQMTGGRVQAWLDGQQQLDFTDTSSPFLAGQAIGVVGKETQGRVRALHFRRGDNVTVTGLVAGDKVVLRSPGGLPLAVKTASGSSLTFGVADGIEHFPAGSVEVNDTHYTGLIWGGDIFQKS